jgi:large subunit ribosomal protein L23
MKTVLIKPLVTEKSSAALNNENKYTFVISEDVNKIEVKNFFQKQFNVKVESVNIVALKPKKRRRGKIVGQSKSRRKAIIAVEKGQVVEEIKKLF